VDGRASATARSRKRWRASSHWPGASPGERGANRETTTSGKRCGSIRQGGGNDRGRAVGLLRDGLRLRHDGDTVSMEGLGYSQEQRDAVPQGAIRTRLRQSPRPCRGEAGRERARSRWARIDAFLAARDTDPRRVIGVDMTPAMLSAARQRREGGFQNVSSGWRDRESADRRRHDRRRHLDCVVTSRRQGARLLRSEAALRSGGRLW